MALIGTLVVAVTFASAMAGARLLGATARSTFLVAFLAMFVAPWSWQVRAQSFALPLFVWTLVLAADHVRRPSRRILLAVPLLVLWANVHGSVLLGSLVVSLALVVSAVRQRSRQASLVAAGAFVATWVATFVTPYGFGIFAYYRLMLVHPPFASLISEWQRTTPSRHHRRLLRPRRDHDRARDLAAASPLAVRHPRFRTDAGRSTAGSAGNRLVHARRDRAPAAPARRCDPTTRHRADATGERDAFADSHHRRRGRLRRCRREAAVVVRAPMADRRTGGRRRAGQPRCWPATVTPTGCSAHPSLARTTRLQHPLELYSRRQIVALARFDYKHGSRWDRVGRGYDVIVVDENSDSPPTSALLREPGVRAAYRDAKIAVLTRHV